MTSLHGIVLGDVFPDRMGDVARLILISGLPAVHTRLRWSSRFPFRKRGTRRESWPDYCH